MNKDAAKQLAATAISSYLQKNEAYWELGKSPFSIVHNSGMVEVSVAIHECLDSEIDDPEWILEYQAVVSSIDGTIAGDSTKSIEDAITDLCAQMKRRVTRIQRAIQELEG